MWEIIAAAVTAFAGIITAYFNYKNKKDSDFQKQINKDKETFIRQKLKETEDLLIKSMETDITAVPVLRKKLEYYRDQLRKYVVILVLVIIPFLSGCLTTKEPMVIGERIFMPKPGDMITVPVLKHPAKQWYLIDDKAMLEVLGIDKPSVPDIAIGVQK